MPWCPKISGQVKFKNVKASDSVDVAKAFCKYILATNEIGSFLHVLIFFLWQLRQLSYF